MKYSSEYAKVDRLRRSINIFINTKPDQSAWWINGRMPADMRRRMASIIRQAKKIDETKL